ncbi:ankyrin repeat domain-containing protein [Hydrogenophaga sp.]|uniref:ankyrin repeat domain-containing protein n=1 Tax=Hydrogenophaga sp. TaxID=1904254 RepID=UPI002614227D|nr:ankyrin repeat domain-containing protein [Hydrogenophaga sp.]
MKTSQKNIVFKWLLVLSIGLSTAAWADSFSDFFSAVKRNDVSALRQLAQRGFDLNTRNEQGEPALFLALRDGAWEVSGFLLGEPSVQVEVRTRQDETPLMMAALKGRLELARRLIERKAEVNKPGWTPLHYAATNADAGSLALTRLLLEHHAYIDAESPNGSTPLMMAAHYGHPSVVKLLLEEGADPLLKNQQGLSAIDFANRAQRAESAEIIAAFVRARQPQGRW